LNLQESFTITVASILPICFELAGLQLHRYVSHFLCSFISLRIWSVKDLNFAMNIVVNVAVNIAQTWKKMWWEKLLTCYSILLWILFYCSFIPLLQLVVFASAVVIEFVNFMSLFVCSAFAFDINFVIVLLLVLQLSWEVVQKMKGKTLQLRREVVQKRKGKTLQLS
jgi:hypothetical protein